MLISCLVLALSTTAFAQQTHKDYYSLTSVSLLIYEADVTTDNLSAGLEDDSLRNRFSGGYGVETIIGGYLSNYVGVGAGVSYSRYAELDINALPVFLDLRLWSYESSAPFVYGKIGTLGRINSHFVGGGFAEFGGGFKFRAGESLTMTFNAFYNDSWMSFTDQPYRLAAKTADTVTIGFTLGVMF